MPGPILHMGATVLCSHGGQAMPTAPSPRCSSRACRSRRSPRRTPSRAAPFVPPARQRPVRHRAMDGRRDAVLSHGQPLAIMTGVSICAPTGTPLLPVAAQTRVLAT